MLKRRVPRNNRMIKIVFAGALILTCGFGYKFKKRGYLKQVEVI
jgi:hypothetical protein